MSLPEPSFIDRDVTVITAEMVASWEKLTGKTLYPGQIESLLIDLIAYRENLLRIGIQEAAKQNLVSYARAPMLDYLGELVGVTRLDGETNDALRERIKLAPEAFTTAGSRGSYIYQAKSADASIIDVAVLSSIPGTVQIYPLLATGTPDQALLDLVSLACSAETVRPLCDTVTVAAPTRKVFSISAIIDIFATSDPATVLEQVNTVLASYASGLRLSLGRDVVLTQIIAVINGVTGVYKTTMAAPVADVVNADNEWSDCTSITVTLGNSVNG